MFKEVVGGLSEIGLLDKILRLGFDSLHPGGFLPGADIQGPSAWQ